MQIVVAQHCGFCRGVRRAVDTAMTIEPENTFILGALIHNDAVVKRVEERGIKTVESVNEVPFGATLLIRSHGVGKAVYLSAEARNIRIVDCTCSFVAAIQRIVEKAGREGRTVVITGNAAHPEVKGLIGWCLGEAYVAQSEDEDFSFLREKNVTIVSQTTFSKKRFSKITENLKKVCQKTVEIFETICYTTVERQDEVVKIAQTTDAVLVVGGRESSNTRMLAEIASSVCPHVFTVDGADELQYEKMKNFGRVGVITGASTPDWQTQEVLFKMAENNAEVQETATTVATEEAVTTVTENTETVSAEAPVAEEVAAQEPAPKKAKKAQKSEQTESAMAKVVAAMDDDKGYRNGQLITVKIVSAGDEGIAVSGCGKTDNVISKDDLDCEVYVREEYVQKAVAGEEIEVMVVSVNPVKLSQKMVKKIREEEAMLSEIEAGKEFSVTCTGTNKGGLTAELGTYPVFIPASEIRMGFVRELDNYQGKKLRLKLLEIRKGGKGRRKEIIASQRVILQAEKEARDAAKAEKEAQFFDSIQLDDVVEGKVERTTNFGAFVSVNGFDCLAHISDLAWTAPKTVTDVLEIGKVYEFKVLKIDREAKKVSLGYKQLQPQPWDLAAEKYAVGDVVHGKVVRILPFGAFVELEKGIDGLVHVSQITHEWLENPTSVLTIGAEVDAKIIGFSPADHRINLSIKALEPAPAPVEGEKSERGERAPRKGGKGSPRRNASSKPASDDGEYREWNEGGFGGASIAEMLHLDDENK